MRTRTFRNMLAMGGALALIMTAGALPVSAATSASGDAVIAADVREILDHYHDTVTVTVNDGHVYLKGQFNTGGDHLGAMHEIDRINGVTGVYDYTEDISSDSN